MEEINREYKKSADFFLKSALCVGFTEYP